MNFEWDEKKNDENIRKHYISFVDAWEIFEQPMLIDVDLRENYGETCYIGIGFFRSLAVVVVFTERKGDIIRIISLRKALKYERERFEEYLRNELGTSKDNV